MDPILLTNVSGHHRRRLLVLLLLANGFSSREIARLADLKKRIVDNDAAWWQDRLNAKSRAQAAALAVVRGLLDNDDLGFDGSEAELRRFFEKNEHMCPLERIRSQ